MLHNIRAEHVRFVYGANVLNVQKEGFNPDTYDLEKEKYKDHAAVERWGWEGWNGRRGKARWVAGGGWWAVVGPTRQPATLVLTANPKGASLCILCRGNICWS